MNTPSPEQAELLAAAFEALETAMNAGGPRMPRLLKAARAVQVSTPTLPQTDMSAAETARRFLHGVPEVEAVTTPSSHWHAKGEIDPHARHYNGERAALTLGALTDDELANGAFMNYDQLLSVADMMCPKPGQHMPIVWMTAVKDRIRWLSRSLEHARATLSAPPAADGYGEEASGARLMMLGTTSPPEAVRLMTMLLSAFGSRHPAVDDLAALILKGSVTPPAAVVAQPSQAYMCHETETSCRRCTTVCEATAPVVGIADEQIAALKARFGVTSNGRGIREFTQVKDFALAVVALAASPSSEQGAAEQPLHPATKGLVSRFSAALADKLASAEKKYGYSDGWLRSDWMDECRAKLLEHIAKGDPRDVAAYCAFLWHHGEKTALAASPAAVAQSVADALVRLDAMYADLCDEAPERPDWLRSALRTARAALAASPIAPQAGQAGEEKAK